MKIGMLYFNNDPKMELKDKIRGAADYYIKKYKQIPNLCFVHPSMKGEAPEGIELRTNRTVLPNHLWIGVGSD